MVATAFSSAKPKSARSCALVLGSFFAVCTAAGAVVPVEERRTIIYAHDAERELRADVYRPESLSGLLPAILCIHGGGWWKGTRSDHAELARSLAERGYVAVAISYRLTGEARFPAQIQDAKAAVRWLRANAAKMGIDPTAIGAIGDSAGGHLAALLATSSGEATLEGTVSNPGESSTLQAAVAIAAQADLDAPHLRENFRHPEKLGIWKNFLGGSHRDVPERYHAASPATYLDADDPPLAFIAAENDDPSTHADSVRRRMLALGVPTRLTIIKGATHDLLRNPEWTRQAVNAAVQFFDLHLKQHGRVPVTGAASEKLKPLFADSYWRMIGGGYAGSEGAQWIREDGEPTLIFAAHHDFFAFKWDSRRGLRVWREDSPEATAFRPDGKGGYLVTEQTTRRIVRWDANARVTEVLVEKFGGMRLNRPNDIALKRDGTLWFTDPDFLFNLRPAEVKELEGQYVFRFDPRTKDLRAVVRDLKLPNGIAFSPDESWLYLTDMARDSILRAPVRTEGTLGPIEDFGRVPAKGLDGLAFDAAGRLWATALDGIHVFDQDGNDLGTLKLPFKPTSISFSDETAPMVCITTREAAFIARLQ